jgi:predicted dehydrogenase
MDTKTLSAPFRLGLVGAANQGREHLRAARHANGVTFVAFCDPDATTRAKTSGEFPGPTAYEGLAEMVARADLDGLVVALPHHVVAEMWTELLDAGLPLLKEKPLGRDLAEARLFVESARAKGVGLVTAVQRRQHPSYLALRACLGLCDAAELPLDPSEPLPLLLQQSTPERLTEAGPILSVSARLHLGIKDNPTGWRGDRKQSGGGALVDSGYHMVDLVQSLVGPIELVHATILTNGVPSGPQSVDSDAILTGRAGRAWVRVESRSCGPRGKFEEVVVDTEHHRWRATREGVERDGLNIYKCERTWTLAMQRQFESFVQRVKDERFDDGQFWEQLPAMRVIQSAYAVMSNFGPIGESSVAPKGDRP